MTVSSTLVIAALALAALLSATAAQASRGPTPGDPVRFDRLVSIGDVLQDAQAHRRTVHILYVHGMRADSSGASSAFLDVLAASDLVGTLVRQPATRFRLWEPRADEQPPIEFAGSPLTDGDWEKAWRRSIPFVSRTVFASDEGYRVVVDEVNWWPLLMGLRCRALVGPDAGLSGPSDQLALCRQDQELGDTADPYFPWLGKIGAPPIGRGSFANRWVKQNIINWGVGDAVIAAGPMRYYLRKAMDAAARASLDGSPQAQRILIAESLGSFVAMDAARDRDSATRKLVEETRHFYFLANQLALLEMARVRKVPFSPELPGQGAADGKAEGFAGEADEGSLASIFREAGSRAGAEGLVGPRPAQIVAISDPSDALTYLVPPLPGVCVSNIQWRFSGGPFGIWANPLKAHRGGITGKRAWTLLLKPNGHDPGKAGPTC